MRVLVALIAAAVGFLLVSQLRGQERFSRRLQAESEGDLARILSSLNTEADSLRDEIDALKLQLLSVQTSSQRDDAAVRAAQEQLASLEVLAGTVPVHGPGIILRIDDPEGSVRYDALIDAVEELRDAGAEAIAVDRVRVAASSAFSEAGGGIVLDDTPLSAPYEVVAIGSPPTLESGLSIPGGASDTLSALRGVKITVTREADVVLPAVARTPTFRVGRPVGSTG